MQLHDAGLNLSLAPAGGLAVAPSSHLTDDLRALIRSSKALLIDWLTAVDDASNHAPDPSKDSSDWKELAASYYAHHFNCPTCITAGLDSRYGQRCGAGLALWAVIGTANHQLLRPINMTTPLFPPPLTPSL
jgi:hypothetical protein